MSIPDEVKFYTRCPLSPNGIHSLQADLTCMHCQFDPFGATRCKSCWAAYGHKRGCATWATSQAEETAQYAMNQTGFAHPPIAPPISIEQSAHFKTFMNPSEKDRIQALGMGILLS